jgi:hypothetical protein
MKWSLMLLALRLMLASAPVSAQQPSYLLTVPVYESVPASLKRMREVLTALHASFSTDPALGYIAANIGGQLRSVTVMEDGASIDPTTAKFTRLNVTCVDGEGKAEALCREIQRRYERR